MIDEELYQLAEDELNSDRRKQDIWARACALASDDHDEARYLYTNLRVEEMLAEREAGNDPLAAVSAHKPLNSETVSPQADDDSEMVTQEEYTGLALEPLDLSHLEEEKTDDQYSEIRISSMRPGVDASEDDDKLNSDDVREAISDEAVADAPEERTDVFSAEEIADIAGEDHTDQVSSIRGTTNLDLNEASDIDLNVDDLGLNGGGDENGSLSFDEADLAALGIKPDEKPEPEAPKISSLDELFDEVDDRAGPSENQAINSNADNSNADIDDIVDADIVESESISALVPHAPQTTAPADANDVRDEAFTREMERQAEDLPDVENDVVSYTSKLENELPDMLQSEPLAEDFDDLSNDLSSVPKEVLAGGAGAIAAGTAALASAGNDAREKVKPDYADKSDFRDDLDIEHSDELYDNYRDPVDLTDTGSGSRYAVYVRNNKTKAIRMGVSWTALFFTLPWLIYRRLFGTAIVYSVVWLVLLTGLIVSGLSWLDAGPTVSNAQRLIAFGFALLSVIGLLYIPFCFGNTWRANKLEKRGYDLAAWVRAKSSRKAITTARRESALA